MRRYQKHRGHYLFLNRKGQVWVETVIYTLIGLAIIGLVLAGAMPKIKQKKDEMAISKSIKALGNIDDNIYTVSRAIGNRRVINLDVKRGTFIIDPSANTISWILDSSFAYSQVGKTVQFGNINITTTEHGNFKVKLKIKYNMDIQYDEDNTNQKQFSVAPIPYKLIIENAGVDKNGKTLIRFSQA